MPVLWIIRKLRTLGYLEARINESMATGYDPLTSEEPDLACIMAASVQNRIVYGEGTGQQVRRIRAGSHDDSERPTLIGTSHLRQDKEVTH